MSTFLTFWQYCQRAYGYVFGPIRDPAGPPLEGAQASRVRLLVMCVAYVQFAITVPSIILKLIGLGWAGFVLCWLSLLILALLSGRIPGVRITATWCDGVGVAYHTVNPARVIYQQLSFFSGGAVVVLVARVLMTDYRPPVGQTPLDIVVAQLLYVTPVLPLLLAILGMARIFQSSWQSWRRVSERERRLVSPA